MAAAKAASAICCSIRRCIGSSSTPDERVEADAIGGYLHYLRRIARNRGPETATSVYFDPAWYLRRYPAVARGDRRRRVALRAASLSVQRHARREFDPLPEFSEAYYLERYKDVAAAVEANVTGATATIIS